jgi:hypothetical protein
MDGMGPALIIVRSMTVFEFNSHVTYGTIHGVKDGCNATTLYYLKGPDGSGHSLNWLFGHLSIS